MSEEFVMKTVDSVHLSLRITKYSVFCHAKQGWNRYLRGKLWQKLALPLVELVVIHNNGISSTKKRAWKRSVIVSTT